MAKRGGILIAVIAIALIGVLLTQSNNFLTYFAVLQPSDLDVYIELYPLSKEVQQGDYISIFTRIDTHMEEIVDVIVSYTITDNKGTIVLKKARTLSIRQTGELIENLIAHQTLDPGPYFVDVEVRYKDIVKSETDTFQVIKEPFLSPLADNRSMVLVYSIGIMLIIFFIVLWTQNRKLNKMLKYHEKADLGHVIKEE